MPRPHRETIKTVETPLGRYELERVGDRYKLWLHCTGGRLKKFPLDASALRDLGSAMLVEGASNDYRV